MDGIEAEWDGHLNLVDAGKMELVRFDPTGGVLPARSFATLGDPYWGIRFFGDTAVYMTQVREPPRPGFAVRWVEGATSTDLVYVDLKTRGQAKFECGRRTVYLRAMPVLFQLMPRWTMREGVLATSNMEDFKIDFSSRAGWCARFGAPPRAVRRRPAMPSWPFREGSRLVCRTVSSHRETWSNSSGWRSDCRRLPIFGLRLTVFFGSSDSPSRPAPSPPT